MRTVEVDVWVTPASPKAWLVSPYSSNGSAGGVFLPVSQVSNWWPLSETAHGQREPGHVFAGWRLEMPAWLARQKGLLDEPR